MSGAMGAPIRFRHLRALLVDRPAHRFSEALTMTSKTLPGFRDPHAVKPAPPVREPDRCTHPECNGAPIFGPAYGLQIDGAPHVYCALHYDRYVEERRR